MRFFIVFYCFMVFGFYCFLLFFIVLWFMVFIVFYCFLLFYGLVYVKKVNLFKNKIKFKNVDNLIKIINKIL
jgi:uncharacterized membrane protein